MATRRLYPDNAAKQKAYRERREVLATNFDKLAAALTHALDRGRAHKIADNLPEEPNARCRELIARLEEVALVVFPPRHPKS